MVSLLLNESAVLLELYICLIRAIGWAALFKGKHPPAELIPVEGNSSSIDQATHSNQICGSDLKDKDKDKEQR